MNTCCASPRGAASCAAPQTTRSAASVPGVKTYRPRVDLVETGSEFQIIAEVPGATAESIDVQFEKDVLTLTAKVGPRDRTEGTWLRREYGVGDFSRSFRLGEGLDPSGISAEFEQGVLTVRVPKAVAAQARKIPVQNN